MRLLISCVAMTVLATSNVSAQSPTRGGDRVPLTWESSCELVKKASGDGRTPAMYEYKRCVQNHSASDVMAVHWDGAGYGKRKISPGPPVCEPTVIASAPADRPRKATLYFGAGAIPSYLTSVWVPKEGWDSSTVTASLKAAGVLSEIRYASQASPGAPEAAGNLTIHSSVETAAGDQSNLVYVFTNETPSPLAVSVRNPSGATTTKINLTLEPGKSVTQMYRISKPQEGLVKRESMLVEIRAGFNDLPNRKAIIIGLGVF
jgi:hypothetical protein